MQQRIRYAQVGLGLRSWLYSLAAVNRFPDHAALVGLCDANAGRLAQRIGWARANGLEVPGYAPGDFERMIAETRPDRVIVTTPDRDHDAYLCRAMELGCDVVTEKPLTIDAVRLQRILDAQRATGRRCTVTFNYRYAPPRAQVRELLASGAIGEVRSVEFQWLLDTTHGADYFRRWHRRKENSGGLLVHKATHHFDLVNWWIGSVPKRVFATGSRRFYTPAQAHARGLDQRGERCLGCPEAGRCPFFLDLRQGFLRALYLEHETHDGYHRDQCVFSETIDIEDSVSVAVEYRSGVHLSYALEAASPWEGYVVAFNGTKGRLEHRCRETVYVSGDGRDPGALLPDETRTTLLLHFEKPVELEVWTGEGGHGGGDEKLAEDLFAPSIAMDCWGRRADHRAGAWSILTGIAANRSIETGRAVDVETLVRGLELPDGVNPESTHPAGALETKAAQPSGA